MPSWVSMPLIYALAALALAGIAGTGVQTVRMYDARADEAKAVSELAGQRADWQKERADAIADALRIEREDTARKAQAAEQYEKDKANAERTETRVVADLAGDVLRLRKHWTACESRRVSEADAAAAELDEATRLRNEAAAAVVRVGAECDAHVRGLQGTVRADRAP